MHGLAGFLPSVTLIAATSVGAFADNLRPPSARKLPHFQSPYALSSPSGQFSDRNNQADAGSENRYYTDTRVTKSVLGPAFSTTYGWQMQTCRIDVWGCF
jgi:hypothetical protein